MEVIFLLRRLVFEHELGSNVIRLTHKRGVNCKDLKNDGLKLFIVKFGKQPLVLQNGVVSVTRGID